MPGSGKRGEERHSPGNERRDQYDPGGPKSLRDVTSRNSRDHVTPEVGRQDRALKLLAPVVAWPVLKND